MNTKKRPRGVKFSKKETLTEDGVHHQRVMMFKDMELYRCDHCKKYFDIYNIMENKLSGHLVWHPEENRFFQVGKYCQECYSGMKTGRIKDKMTGGFINPNRRITHDPNEDLTDNRYR